jgi:hypothetical protein
VRGCKILSVVVGVCVFAGVYVHVYMFHAMIFLCVCMFLRVRSRVSRSYLLFGLFKRVFRCVVCVAHRMSVVCCVNAYGGSSNVASAITSDELLPHMRAVDC